MKEDVFNRLSKTYQSHPKIEVKMLWHAKYWDGPENGLCKVDNQKFWFELIEEYYDNNPYQSDDLAFIPPWYRRYVVMRLSQELLTDFEVRHEAFRLLVGGHTDYDDNGKRGHFEYNDTITKETVSKFYRESEMNRHQEVNPDDQDIIGWFEM